LLNLHSFLIRNFLYKDIKYFSDSFSSDFICKGIEMQNILILIILLNFWSVECQNFGNCDYYQFLEPGRVYQISSLGFRYGRPAPLYVYLLLSRFKRTAETWISREVSELFLHTKSNPRMELFELKNSSPSRNLQIQSKISIDFITALANAIRALFHVHKQNYIHKKTYRNTNCRYAAEAPYGYKITASCRLGYLLPVRLFFIHKS